MIIEEYDESMFIRRFEDYKRVETDENKNGNFSYRGLRALFGYIVECDENPYKLDVIGLCCEFSEYKNLDEYLRDFYQKEDIQKIEEEIRNDNNIKDEEEFNELLKERIEEEINNKTTLIKFDGDLDEGFIIESY